MEVLRNGHSESGGRWCQRPSNQPSFHQLCVCSGWWRGPWSGLAVLSASKAALDMQRWCPWTPAGAGTCLFCGVLCGNVFNDRHMTCTVNVTNWALYNFKNRERLCQICGCSWQSCHHLVPWRPSWCTWCLPPSKLSLKKRPPGKMWFSNLKNPVCGVWRLPWPGTQISHFSGFSCSLHCVWTWGENSEILLLWSLSFLSPSPLSCVSSLLPSLSFGKSICGTWPQLHMFLKMSAYLSRMVK